MNIIVTPAEIENFISFGNVVIIMFTIIGITFVVAAIGCLMMAYLESDSNFCICATIFSLVAFFCFYASNGCQQELKDPIRCIAETKYKNTKKNPPRSLVPQSNVSVTIDNNGKATTIQPVKE